MSRGDPVCTLNNLLEAMMESVQTVDLLQKSIGLLDMPTLNMFIIVLSGIYLIDFLILVCTIASPKRPP